MRLILLLMILITSSGCAAIDGTHFVSATTLGISAGLPDGVTLVIGYRRAEIATCEAGQTLESNIEGEATATGFNGKQSINMGNQEGTND